MKKIMSIMLSLSLVLTVFSFSISANAATDCVEVNITGLQMNYNVNEAIKEINTERTNSSIAPLVADKSLTAIAKRLAAMLEIHYDDEMNLSDGSSIGTVLTKLDSSQGAYFKLISNGNKDSIKEILTSDDLPLNKAPAVKSVGVALFNKGSDYILVTVISLEESQSPVTSTANEAYSKNEKLKANYITSSNISFKDVKNGKHKLTTKVKGDGVSSSSYEVKSGVVYTSSKSSVFKIKGSYGYTKKTGKVTVTAKTKGSKKLCASPISVTTKTYKSTISSCKSTKKKQIALKWKDNIANVSGYEIQYSTDSKFKKNVGKITVKGKKYSKTIKKLKSKKKYYVRVRNYLDQGDGEKLYSPWSKTKTVKVK